MRARAIDHLNARGLQPIEQVQGMGRNGRAAAFRRHHVDAIDAQIKAEGGSVGFKSSLRNINRNDFTTVLNKTVYETFGPTWVFVKKPDFHDQPRDCRRI